MKDAFDWTAERIELLRERWADGVSTAAIGRELGVSKNAVVSKSRRIGCEPRPSPIRAPAGSPQAQRPKRAPVVTLALDNSGAGLAEASRSSRVAPSVRAPESGQPFSVLEHVALRSNRCGWMDGIRGSYRQCNKPAARPRVFCVEHCKVGYVSRKNVAAE